MDGYSKMSYKIGELEFNELSISKDTNNVSKDDHNAWFNIEYDRNTDADLDPSLRPGLITGSADSHLDYDIDAF